MAYTLRRRTRRCAHLGCKAPGVDHLSSEVLGIDDQFCPDHALHVVHLYPGYVVYHRPAEHRVQQRRWLGRTQRA